MNYIELTTNSGGVHNRGNERFAIKVIRVSTDTTNPIIAELELEKLRPVRADIVEREINIQKSLESEFIGEILHFHNDGALYWILMPYYEYNLRDLIPTTEGRAKILVRQIAMGLETILSKNYSHKDLKPENVAVDSDGNVKIIDFGLASTDCEVDFNITGTPKYISPEIYSKHGNSCKSDIWALGIIFYELLAGDFIYVQSEEAKRKLKILNEKIGKQSLKYIPIMMADAKQLLIKKIQHEDILKQIKRLGQELRFRDVDPEIIDLIESMLNIDPDKRPEPSKIVDMLS